ncbi:hypothetical protein ACQCSE_20640, partial [Ralstonia pseudosolanacearum]
FCRMALEKPTLAVDERFATNSLRAKTEPAGSGDFINLWSGQAPRLATEDSAEAITRRIASQALARLAPATRLA